MSERDGYIPGVPCWVDTTQPDPAAAGAFYGGLFGWEFEDMMPAGSGGQYLVARRHGGDVAAVSSAPEGTPPRAEWNTYIWVDDAKDAAATARRAGGRVLTEPFEVMDAGRMAVVADPEGAVFCVWEARAHKGARVVNEHGALNFNGLVTRDLDGAQAFYGAVFDWKLLTIPAGTMWALPGYGDHLEALTPGLRAQMEQMHAPEGFIDVVAAVNPIVRDTTETAHWNVTFGIDDADAAAKTAIALGGEVVAGPVDAPWARSALLRDPQGATFIVSQFVPENSGLTS